MEAHAWMHARMQGSDRRERLYLLVCTAVAFPLDREVFERGEIVAVL
jgi:hypothetical protein